MQGQGPVSIHGFVAPGYERVRDAFETNFRERQEVGAAVAVWSGGKPIVSLWGGVASPAADSQSDAHTDQTPAREWTQDTIIPVFSMTKAITATCIHHLAERRQLDLDAPVARYWPEFAQSGKQDITLRMVLGHRAGLPLVEAELTLEQALSWDPVVESLARQAPLWEPGSAHGYHFRTFGWLLGEVFRRVAGRTVGRYFADVIAKPLGLGWYLGQGPEHDAKRALLVPPPPSYHEMIAKLPQDMLLVRAMSTPSNLFHYSDMWNRPQLLRAELPSSNSVTNAGAAAHFYAALMGQLPAHRILRSETVKAARAVVSSGPDRSLLVSTTFGSGYQLAPTLPGGVSADAFGHAGAGGSVGFADETAGLAFAYTPSRLRFDVSPDPRTEALVRATYQAHASAG